MHHTRSDMVAVIRSVALLVLYFGSLQNPAEGNPLQKLCHISRHKKMQPSTMLLAKELQNLQRPRRSCSQGLRLKNFQDCDIKGKERLMLTLHRVKLVVHVLENMNKTELVTQNLETFAMLENDLTNCEMAKSPQLKTCRQHLNQYRETVTEECLENDVLRSLIWVLTEDLGQLTHGKQSAEDTEKMDLHVTAKPPAAKKRKGNKKKKSKKMKKRD